MNKTLISLAAAAALLLTSACGPGEPAPNCPNGYVAEYDEDGWECEPDADGDGEDDENSEDEDSDKSKKKKSKKAASAPKANKPAKRK